MDAAAVRAPFDTAVPKGCAPAEAVISVRK